MFTIETWVWDSSEEGWDSAEDKVIATTDDIDKAVHSFIQTAEKLGRAASSIEYAIIKLNGQKVEKVSRMGLYYLQKTVDPYAYYKDHLLLMIERLNSPR